MRFRPLAKPLSRCTAASGHPNSHDESAALWRAPSDYKIQRLTPLVAALAILCGQSAHGAARTWANLGTDFNTGANWGGTAPGSNDVGLFTTPQTAQPNLSNSLTIAGLRFSAGATGYDITSSSAAVVLTLNGINTTGSSGTTTASASAIRNDNTTGTTTIDAPLNLAPSTLISTIFQDAADGSTLILNGVISQTGTVALSLKNGTIQLNNNNSYSGGTSVDAAGTIVVVGNNNGLGSGTFTINNTATLQAGGAARTLANNVVLAGDMTVSGSNAFTFNGTLTSSGSASRALTVSNTGGLTQSGNVFLAATDVAGGLTINGTTAVTINGVVTNNSGANTVASNLTYSGSNTLKLANANTYTGTTAVGTSALGSNGTLNAAANGALGSGTTGTSGITVFKGGTFSSWHQPYPLFFRQS